MNNLVFGAAVTLPDAIKTAFSTGIQTATDYATDMISTALPLGIGLFAIVYFNFAEFILHDTLVA